MLLELNLRATALCRAAIIKRQPCCRIDSNQCGSRPSKKGSR